MEKPLVSILIPTYNREKLIAESIQSALDQDYDNFEVIVVDNASTDGTWSQIQRIAFVDSRVRAFRNETNIGPVRNWIECAQQARGTFSKILWSDDLIDPTFLSRTVPLLADQRVGFVYSAARIFKEKTELASSSIYYNHLPTGVYDTAFFIEGSLLDSKYYPVSPGCFLLRTEDLQKNLLADIPNAVGSDFKSHAIGNDLLLLLLTANSYERFGVVNEPLSMFRDHAGSISTTSGMGRLIIHYDMAKAYFVQCFSINKHLRRRFNTLLRLHLQRHDSESFGIRRLQDFYPAAADTSISITYLIGRAFRRLLRITHSPLVPPALTDRVAGTVQTRRLEGGKRLQATPTCETPLLSIITVVYNGVENIAATIESVLNIKTDKIEYLVIDGGSIDGTEELLCHYDNRLDYWLSEKDAGIYDAMNKGIRLARGRYVYHLNIGDVLLCIPDKLFGDLPLGTAGLAGCVRIGDNKVHKPSDGLGLRLRNTLHHQGCFYRRNSGFHYDTRYRVFADFDLNQRLIQSGQRFELVDDIVASHDPGGISHNFRHFHEVFEIVRTNQGLFWLATSFLYFKLRGLFSRMHLA